MTISLSLEGGSLEGGSLEGAIASLAAEFELGVGMAVVDLGAETGEASRLLSATGARVIAVEPSPAMRARLAPAVATVEIIDGRAGELPLPEWTADLVVIRDASAWLGTEEAVTEVHRVLRPGGGLALIGAAPRAWSVSPVWLALRFSAVEQNEFVDWCRKL